MQNRLFKWDSTRALIASRSCVAIVIGYGLSLYFGWKASSVATTVIVLQTANLGTTFSKSVLRMTGTLTGAFAGWALVATCAHNRELFILSMALMTGFCVWGMQTSKNTYAWQLALLTCAIVGWPGSSNPLTSFQSSIDRVTAVTVGVVLSGMVHGIFWPITARLQFEQSVENLLHQIRQLFQTTETQPTLKAHELNRQQMKILSLSTSLDGLLKEARSDSSQIKIHYDNYLHICAQLKRLAFSATSFSDIVILCQHFHSESEKAVPTAIHNVLEQLSKSCTRISQIWSTVRRSNLSVVDPDEFPEDLSVDNSLLPDSPMIKLLTSRTRQFEEDAAELREQINHLELPASSPSSREINTESGISTSTRLKKTILSVLQVFIGAWFFILLDWPLGLQSSMIVLMIFAFANATLPVTLAAPAIIKSVLFSFPLSAVFYFYIMPRIDSFTELAPLLFLLFFPFMYGITSDNPLKSMSALIAIIFTNSLISISNTPPTYDLVSFTNTYLGMSGGVTTILFLSYLFETRSPRRGIHKLLTAILCQSAEQLKAVDTNIPHRLQKDHALHSQLEKMWQNLNQLKKLSAIVDYRQDPLCSRNQIRKILNSFELLVWRTIETIELASTTESTHEDTKASREFCERLLSDTSQSLADFQPVDISATTLPLTPDSNVTPCLFLSLCEAIASCQRELNQVNWKRWCQSYF